MRQVKKPPTHRERSWQADSAAEMRDLRAVDIGGVAFTSIQKFRGEGFRHSTGALLMGIQSNWGIEKLAALYQPELSHPSRYSLTVLSARWIVRLSTEMFVVSDTKPTDVVISVNTHKNVHTVAAVSARWASEAQIGQTGLLIIFEACDLHLRRLPGLQLRHQLETPQFCMAPWHRDIPLAVR